MNDVARSPHVRRMIRKSTKRVVRQKVKKAVAQQLVMEGMQKRSIDGLLSYASRKEMREIIDLYESHKEEFIRVQKEVDRRIIKEGSFVKSRKDVHGILKSHNMLDRKGRLLNESMGEFALDMLFGVGPVITGILSKPFPALAVGTFGLGIAGMTYYGYKIADALSAGEKIDAFFHTIGFISSAGAAFPLSPFGGLSAGINAAMGKLLEVMFWPIKTLFGLVVKGGSGVFSALYRASALAVEKEGSKQVVKAGGTAVVKQAEKEGAKQVAKAGGTEVAKQAEKKVAQEALEEVEEQGAKFVEKLSQNSKITKFFAKMTKGGADIAKKGIDLLSKAVGYLKDMRVVGSLFAKLEFFDLIISVFFAPRESLYVILNIGEFISVTDS